MSVSPAHLHLIPRLGASPPPPPPPPPHKAAAIGEKDKEDEYRRDIDGGAYEWVPVVMESGGRLGKGSMRVLNRLATIAAKSDGVEKHVFVRRAQETLSVARVRGNGYVWKQGLQAMAYGGGRCFQTGLDREAHRRSGLIVHADVVMTSVSIASRLACSAP